MRNILILSGKGGVGKTTFAVNLATYLSKKYKVGLLDVDIHGPNVPKMLNLEGKRIYLKNQKFTPIKYNKNLEVVSIAFLLESEDDAVIWRGPMKHKLISQFVKDIKWSYLNFLIIDLPPGTGDEAISISQLLTNSEAIIISMPQQVSLMDMKKAVNFAKKMKLKIDGLIENMSGKIFGSGTIKEFAKKENIPFLGSIKLSSEISKLNDRGIPFVEKEDDISKDFQNIVKKIELIKKGD